VLVFGYGFPPERGGLMFYGDRVGFDHVLARVREFQAARNGWAWEPSPLLIQWAETKA
jgi:3-hydroxyacyl-CoA dehydrogenase